MFDFLKMKTKYFFPRIIKGTYNFPCKNCLVIACCSKAGECKKLEFNSVKIRELFLEHECCIDCGCTHLHEGSSGGLATNVKCVNCGHWFNMGLPLFIERIHMPGYRENE